MSKLDDYFKTKWLIIAVTFTMTILLFTHIPRKIMPPQLQQWNIDKLYHVVAYGAITFLFILSLKESPSLLCALILFFSIGIVGIIDEITQPFVNRTASISDFTANVPDAFTIYPFHLEMRTFSISFMAIFALKELKKLRHIE